MLQKLNWMFISENENEITNVLLRSDVYCEFVCHFVKLVALSTKLSARKRIWSIENEVEFLKMKLSERKWNRMPENESPVFSLKLTRACQQAINFVAKLKDHSLIWMK